MKRMPVKLIECFGCERYVLKFHKAHRPVLFSAETEPLVASLLGEHGLQFILGRVDREIPDIKRIARGILVGRINRRIIVSLIML